MIDQARLDYRVDVTRLTVLSLRVNAEQVKSRPLMVRYQKIMPERGVPKDQVNLRLLLVDGKSHDFLFDPNTPASEIALHVFHNWPSDWEDGGMTRPERPEILRLIYRGRFLHATTTPAAVSLPLGKTTVLHMIAREKLPDEQRVDSQAARVKSTRGSTQSCCCTIL